MTNGLGSIIPERSTVILIDVNVYCIGRYHMKFLLLLQIPNVSRCSLSHADHLQNCHGLLRDAFDTILLFVSSTPDEWLHIHSFLDIDFVSS